MGYELVIHHSQRFRENSYKETQIHVGAALIQLQEAIDLLKQHLLNTGVGGLPLLNDPEVIPTEETLLDEITKALQIKYERLKGIQDNAAVASNLLSR